MDKTGNEQQEKGTEAIDIMLDNHKKVLIIDDSTIITKHLIQILSGGDYKIVGTATDGESGMRLYRKIFKIVDVILLDINMPKMDGIKTLEHIMAFNKDARVVMISTEGTGEMVKKAIRIGARAFVVKPPVRETLLERIDFALK